MKYSKDGFSLSEILIALTIIGIVSVLTIAPSLDSAINSHHIKAYKAAYDKIATSLIDDIKSNELYGDKLATEAKAEILWAKMNDYIQAQGYSDESDPKDKPGEIVQMKNLKPSARWCGNDSCTYSKEIGVTPLVAGKFAYKVNQFAPWIVTEGGISYTVKYNEDYDCHSILQINSAETVKEALSHSCAQIVVDVNGIHKGPNEFDVKSNEISQKLITPDTQLDDFIAKDRFRIYVGHDGITAGPKGYSTAGRFMYEN